MFTVWNRQISFSRVQKPRLDEKFVDAAKNQPLKVRKPAESAASEAVVPGAAIADGSTPYIADGSTPYAPAALLNALPPYGSPALTCN